MNQISIIVGLVLSIIATVLSVFNFLNRRKEHYSSIISKSRLVCMDNLTKLLSVFIDAYINCGECAKISDRKLR